MAAPTNLATALRRGSRTAARWVFAQPSPIPAAVRAAHSAARRPDFSPFAARPMSCTPPKSASGGQAAAPSHCAPPVANGSGNGSAAEDPCTPCESTCTVTIQKGENCWQCHGPRKPARCAQTLFCDGCGHIQPPAPSCNYFELLGIKHERFDIDMPLLEANYKALMRKLHPDRFMQKKPQELEFSQAQCSAVNVAYSTLRCPFRRATYMLRRMGVDFEDGTSNMDPEFMMEVLEASSEIEDSDRDQERLLKVRDEFYRPHLASCELEFQGAFQEGDVQKAAAATARLQYLRRVHQQLRDVVELEQ